MLVPCVLSLDIQLRAFWRTFLHKHHFRKGRVLLTGATGFLGSFLLKEMLLNSKVCVNLTLVLAIACIVRRHLRLVGLDGQVRIINRGGLFFVAYEDFRGRLLINQCSTALFFKW